MQISKLGEFGLIERFRRQIKADSSVFKGSGDDCAVLKFDRKHYQLFTCDMIVEGVDFTRKAPAYLVGRKAVAVSISDIASCSGLPRHCVISLGLPRNTSLKLVDGIFKGILDTAKEFKVNLVGGDLSRAGQIMIDVSMLGLVEINKLTLRSGAKPGDIIFTSGALGGSIRGRHLNFTPRVKEARFLAKNFKINSMIDISDGLAQDLGQITKESGAGAALYEILIPINKAARSLKEALFMGEDFELLFTMAPKEAKKLLKISRKFQPIGTIMDKNYGLRLITKEGKEKPLSAKSGFSHF